MNLLTSYIYNHLSANIISSSSDDDDYNDDDPNNYDYGYHVQKSECCLPPKDVKTILGNEMLTDNTIHFVQQMLKKVGL